MPTKGTPSSTTWVDPDDAPELTGEWFANAEIFEGDKYVRRRGRPPSPDKKEQISVRLDPEVLAKLREVGPGWQTQINPLLRSSLGLDKPRAKKVPRRTIAKTTTARSTPVPRTAEAPLKPHSKRMLETALAKTAVKRNPRAPKREEPAAARKRTEKLPATAPRTAAKHVT
jgi:uncharacterized protein (DUF4415 family)